MNESRINKVKTCDKQGIIAYLSNRDLRLHDNFGLYYAQKEAERLNRGLVVIVCLDMISMYLSARHYKFLLEGLHEFKADLKKINTKLFVFETEPELVKFLDQEEVAHVVYDFMPLKRFKNKIGKLKQLDDIALTEIDSHNLVPARFLSNKQEYGAVQLRKRIKQSLEMFLYEESKLTKQEKEFTLKYEYKRLDEIEKNLIKDDRVFGINWLLGGYSNAKRVLWEFCEDKLHNYAQNRNNPAQDALSNLSPYLHFGQISQKRVVQEVIKKDTSNSSNFLDELLVRTALAENYCCFNEDYDNIKGFPNWAKLSLEKHKNDIRPRRYTLESLEKAQTDDDIWNTAQIQMTEMGKMHSYLRMYWAKKLLEWCENPETAQKWAIYLNDKYELDGTDPNGYTGIAWSIGGVHDRAFAEREIYGKVRYMSYKGCKKKFKL